VMSTTCLTSLLRKYTHTVAGHEHKGHYLVDRAQVQLPISLVNEVFPLVKRDFGRYSDATRAKAPCCYGGFGPGLPFGKAELWDILTRLGPKLPGS
jgi:NADH dehydrogenase/NADH:ubiquinone oxidoreductase subunit G